MHALAAVNFDIGDEEKIFASVGIIKYSPGAVRTATFSLASITKPSLPP
jgi:hypothetical protein